MKRLIFLLVPMFALNTAFAATPVSLPARRVVMTGDGKTPARYDITAELAKKGIAKDQAARLSSVSVKAKVGSTGATVGLVIGTEFVDSITITDENETQFTLEGDTSLSGRPWYLSVRGELQVVELIANLDGVSAPTPKPQPKPEPTTPTQPKPQPAPQPAPTTPAPTPTTPAPAPTQPKPQPAPQPAPTTPAPTPAPKPQPAPKPLPNLPPDDLRSGQIVIAVSRNSGRIENVEIVRRESDGTYTVRFDGDEYTAWSRSQLALTTGCGGGFCVGRNAFLNIGGRQTEVRVIGLMSNGQIVIEVAGTDDRSVVNGADLSNTRQDSRDDEDIPRPRRPVSPNGARNFPAGSMAYIVDISTNRVWTAQVDSTDGRNVSVRLTDGRSMTFTSNSDRLGSPTGCNRHVCAGQTVVSNDATGRAWEMVVLGIQSEGFVIVREIRSGQTIGNWPSAALQLRR